MDYKKCAIEDLRKYNAMKSSIENMRERISSLYDSYKSVKCSTSDATPVKGGGNMAEERLIGNIVERERLKLNLLATQKLLQAIDRGLGGLTDQERKILDSFYISGKGSIYKLTQELKYEERYVYTLKDAALKKFTIEMYGITDY